MHDCKLSVKRLQLFSINAYVYILKKARAPRAKLLYCAEPSIFVKYKRNTKMFCVYVSNRHVIIKSWDV